MRELKKGSLGMLLLRLLREQPSYGYELCERLRARSDGILTFEDGAIYPLLHDYERRGVIEGYWGADEVTREAISDAPHESSEAPAITAARKGPRRRYYRLTAQGHAALRASVEEWQTFSQAVQRILREGAVDLTTSQYGRR